MRAWDSFADGVKGICCDRRTAEFNPHEGRNSTDVFMGTHTYTNTHRRVTKCADEEPQWKSRLKEIFSMSWIIHEAGQGARFTAALSQRDSWVQIQGTTADEQTQNTLEHATHSYCQRSDIMHLFIIYMNAFVKQSTLSLKLWQEK